MAVKGLSVFRSNGEDFTINDPNIAEEFSSSKAYPAGKFVYYQGNLYRFKENHSGAWNSGHAEQVLLSERVEGYEELVAEEAAAREEAIKETKKTFVAVEDNIFNFGYVFFKASGLKQDAVIDRTDGKVYPGTGTGNNWVYEDFVPIAKGKTIYFQQQPSAIANAYFYNEDLEYIGAAVTDTNFTDLFGVTYQNDSAAFVRFGCYKSTGYSSDCDPFVFAYATNGDPLGSLVNGYGHADKTFTVGMTIVHSAEVLHTDEAIEISYPDGTVKIGALIYDGNGDVIYRTGNSNGDKYFCIPSGFDYRLLIRYADYSNINLSELSFDKFVIRKGRDLLGHLSLSDNPKLVFPNRTRIGNIDVRTADTDILVHNPLSNNGDSWQLMQYSLEFYDDDLTTVLDSWYSKKYDVVIQKGTHYRLNIGKQNNTEMSMDDYEKIQIVPLRDDFQPQIHGVMEQLGIIRRRLSELEGNSVPDYYVNHIKGKAETIETLHDNMTTGDQFIFITDYHANGYNQTGNSKVLMDYLLNHTHLYKVFNGGDLLNTWRLRDTLDYGGMRELVRSVLIEQTPDAPCSYYQILGNHDTGMDYDGQGGQCGPFISAQELFDISGQGIFHPYAVRDLWSSGWQYHFDDNVNKIRYLIMNGSLSGTGSGEASFDSIRFIVNSLISVPAGYTVVGLNHIILTNDGSDYTSFTKNLLNCFDAYNAKTEYQFGDVTFNFTGTDGKVACLIGGHQHYDWDGTSTGGIPVIVTTTDNRGGSDNPSSRPAGTVNEQAFDVFTIDTTSKTITATRIGAGSDRTWTYS